MVESSHCMLRAHAHSAPGSAASSHADIGLRYARSLSTSDALGPCTDNQAKSLPGMCSQIGHVTICATTEPSSICYNTSHNNASHNRAKQNHQCAGSDQAKSDHSNSGQLLDWVLPHGHWGQLANCPCPWNGPECLLHLQCCRLPGLRIGKALPHSPTPPQKGPAPFPQPPTEKHDGCSHSSSTSTSIGPSFGCDCSGG